MNQIDRATTDVKDHAAARDGSPQPRLSLHDARALIGWMAPAAAEEALTRVQAGGVDAAAAALAAREVVARRPRGLDQSNVISDPPESVLEHVAELMASPGAADVAAEGWEVKLAELPRLVAVQPHVFTGDGEIDPFDDADLAALARVSLPLPQATQLPARFDHALQAWTITSTNPNLRLMGQFCGEVRPGQLGFGFGVDAPVSMMQAVRFRDRVLLRDGYHRAYRFLCHGVTTVPVFYGEATTLEQVGAATGMLPEDAFLGDRPPTLSDYLDNAVAAMVPRTRFEKTIVIAAMERVTSIA